MLPASSKLLDALLAPDGGGSGSRDGDCDGNGESGSGSGDDHSGGGGDDEGGDGGSPAVSVFISAPHTCVCANIALRFRGRFVISLLLRPPRSYLVTNTARPHNIDSMWRSISVAQAVQQQQLGQAVAALAAVGTGADGAATSSVTSSAASSSGVAPAAATFTEVEPVLFSDDAIVGRSG